MRSVKSVHGVKLWLSANDTDNWAHKPGAAWPCSFLSGRRLFVEFDRRGDLVDLSIDGGRGDQDCPSHELNAIASDYLNELLESAGHDAACSYREAACPCSCWRAVVGAAVR